MKSIFKQETQPGLRTAILVMLALTLMVLDKHVGALAEVRAVLTLPLVPLQYAISSPIKLIDKLQRTISTHDALVKENLDLKAEELLLKAQVQRLLAIESENTQLKALMRSSNQIHSKVLIGELMAIATDPFVHQSTLDKGSHQGVFVGQPVLDANGVIGQVMQVGPLTSRVLLITDALSAVAVRDTRNGIRAIAMGDSYTGKLKLINVPQTADIKVNDVLITSGLGEHYPEGYPVGKVISVEKNPAYPFAMVTIEPSAHIDRSREVLLVWNNK